MLQIYEKYYAPNFTFYPLAWLTVSFALGIFLSNFLQISWQIYLISSLIFAFLTVIFLRKNYTRVFLIFAFIALGGLSFQVENESISPNRLRILYDTDQLVSGEPLELTGIVQGKPELAVGGFFLKVDSEKIFFNGEEKEVSGNVRLFLPIRDEEIAQEYEDLQLNYGIRIRVSATFIREEKFQNPGGISNKKILEQQGNDATATVKSPLLIENIGYSDSFEPLGWVYDRRQNLIIEFKKNFSVSTAGVLIASLLGNKYHLDKITSESFREGGTFHILVISGLQITFIGGLAILFLRFFTKNRFWQFLLATVFLWCYTLAVGADAPVSRAALMFTFWYFAYVVFRQATLLNTLATSGLALLIWSPSDIFDQSLQLTFMCVLSIVAVAVPLLENLQKIGNWHPKAETPIPPNVPNWLKTLSETIYWSEKNWQKELSQEVWHCKLFKSPYAEKLERWHLQKLLRYVFEVIVVSIIVQVWLLPLAVVYFHRISLASIFLNVPIGALMAIESILALIGIFASQISEIFAAPFIWATEIFNWLILNITIFFISFEWSSMRFPHYSGQLKVVYFLYFIPILVLTYLVLRWNPFSLKNENVKRLKIAIIAAPCFVLLLVVIVFHPFSKPIPDGKLRVDFLDVGQGDSALITMPTGETLLVDGGGRASFNKLYVQRENEEPEFFEPDVQNIGETVVSNFLWEKGYDRVDYLMPSHADTDHIQGLTDVARNFSISGVIIARMPLDNPDFAALNEVIYKKKIPITLVSRGDVINFGEVKIEILSPEKSERSETNWNNNQSIVLRITFGETTFLLTGDIEKEAEKELLQNPEILKSDVVKVAHHGSKSSSTQEFINSTKAKIAIIPVGKHSQFGHPDEEVVERWKNSGAKIMRTGENGTITILSDGKNLEIKTYVQN